MCTILTHMCWPHQYCVNNKTVHVTVFTTVPFHSQSSQSFLILSTESNLIYLVPKPANTKSKPVPAAKLKYSMNINIIQFNYVYGIYETHVPLLYLLNMLAHSLPVVASRFATMFLNHSKTVPVGWTYFHRAALLLPMVVSKVTYRHQVKTSPIPSYSAVWHDLLHLLCKNLFSPSHYLGYRNHLKRRLIQDMMKMPEFLQEEVHYLK